MRRGAGGSYDFQMQTNLLWCALWFFFFDQLWVWSFVRKRRERREGNGWQNKINNQAKVVCFFKAWYFQIKMECIQHKKWEPFNSFLFVATKDCPPDKSLLQKKFVNVFYFCFFIFFFVFVLDLRLAIYKKHLLERSFIFRFMPQHKWKQYFFIFSEDNSQLQHFIFLSQFIFFSLIVYSFS